MATRLGVCGWPVAHSRSPAMHNAALAALGLTDWRYQHLPIPPDEFAATVRALEAVGFKGVNVTIPHKAAALAVADSATDVAAAVGAANTLTLRDGKIEADNTDVTAVRTAAGDVAGARALVLGAGGAGRAAVHALVEAGAEVEVWNRTPERARELADALGAEAVIDPRPGAEVIVQSTAVGLGDEANDPFAALPIDADWLRAAATVIDLVYAPGATAFTRAARAAGARVVDGLEILVLQGAASLYGWTGVEAPLAIMRAAVADDTASGGGSTATGNGS